jgi:hypothetical protein
LLGLWRWLKRRRARTRARREACALRRSAHRGLNSEGRARARREAPPSHPPRRAHALRARGARPFNPLSLSLSLARPPSPLPGQSQTHLTPASSASRRSPAISKSADAASSCAAPPIADPRLSAALLPIEGRSPRPAPRHMGSRRFVSTYLCLLRCCCRAYAGDRG